MLYLLPFRMFLQNFAENKRKEALKKSKVKIRANDVVASWKMLLGLATIPLYFG